MSEPRPSIVILAGPNGAGKSTAAPALLEGTLAVKEFVNADVIARDLSADDPASAAIAAGRVMLARLRELAGVQERLRPSWWTCCSTCPSRSARSSACVCTATCRASVMPLGSTPGLPLEN